MPTVRNKLLVLCLVTLSWLPGLPVADEVKVTPSIAIIIDDLGNKLHQGERAVQLPGPVALSFLPHTPHTEVLANQAYAAGKEVMLHLPMESETGTRMGPGGITSHMTEQQVQQTTRGALASIPHVSGLNNHMGSLLTRHPGAMAWLMDTVKEHGGLFFVDSRTTGKTVAMAAAIERELPTAMRDVFLDHVPDKRAIRKEFRRLIRLAKKHGYAVGIGHPHPATMAVLKQELAKLDSSGVKLIPVSQIVKMQHGDNRWHVPAQHSPKVVKK
jgi:uncharacterized protein